MAFDAAVQGARYSRAVASTTCAMWTNLWVQCCVCGGGSDDLAMIILPDMEARIVTRGQRVRSQGASGPNYLEPATNAIAAEGGPRFPDINWLVVACKRGRPRVRIRLPVRPSARAKSLKGILAPMSQFILSTCHPTERRLSFLFCLHFYTIVGGPGCSSISLPTSILACIIITTHPNDIVVAISGHRFHEKD